MNKHIKHLALTIDADSRTTTSNTGLDVTVGFTCRLWFSVYTKIFCSLFVLLVLLFLRNVLELLILVSFYCVTTFKLLK